MNPEKFEALVTGRTQYRLQLSRQKRKGYANEQDCLANFKQVAALCVETGLIPSGCIMANPDGSGIAAFHIIHKIARRINLMRQSLDIAADESRLDTDLDLLNYTDLMAACEKDGRQIRP